MSIDCNRRKEVWSLRSIHVHSSRATLMPLRWLWHGLYPQSLSFALLLMVQRPLSRFVAAAPKIDISSCYHLTLLRLERSNSTRVTSFLLSTFNIKQITFFVEVARRSGILLSSTMLLWGKCRACTQRQLCRRNEGNYLFGSRALKERKLTLGKPKR